MKKLLVIDNKLFHSCGKDTYYAKYELIRDLLFCHQCANSFPGIFSLAFEIGSQKSNIFNWKYFRIKPDMYGAKEIYYEDTI